MSDSGGAKQDSGYQDSGYQDGSYQGNKMNVWQCKPAFRGGGNLTANKPANLNMLTCTTP